MNGAMHLLWEAGTATLLVFGLVVATRGLRQCYRAFPRPRASMQPRLGEYEGLLLPAPVVDPPDAVVAPKLCRWSPGHVGLGDVCLE